MPVLYVLFQLKQGPGHGLCSFRAEPCLCILIDHRFYALVWVPHEALPHPLVKVILRTAGVGAVSDSVPYCFAKHPMIESGPGEEAEPVIDQSEVAIRHTLVDIVAPVRRLIALFIGSRVGLDIAKLGVTPVGNFVVEDQILLRWQLMKYLMEVA